MFCSAGFIECKGGDGEIIEVDIEENRTVGLETLKSLFGTEVSALTYTNPSSGRERVVRVSDSKLLEPVGCWEAQNRVYSISWIPMPFGLYYQTSPRFNSI
jgi:hypothetical protein